MKRSVAWYAVLVIFAAACERTDDQQLVSFSVGLPEQVATPIRTVAGTTLSGRFSGSRAEIVKLDQGTAVPRAAVATEGVITGLQLATGSLKDLTLAVVASCAGGFGNQPDTEEFRTCVTPPSLLSIEVDDQGRARGEQVSLPAGLSEGTLFAGESVFVWEGWDRSNRAVYADGAWQKIASAEPATTRIASRCATKSHLYVLHGNAGPSSMVGADSPEPSKFELFSFLLNGSADNPWLPIAIAGLDSSDSAELACGDGEAFIRAGNSVFSTSSPARAVSGIGSRTDELRANAARRPVLFLEDGSCAVISAGGRLVRNKDKQSSATSARESSCDAVPWPKGSGFVGLTQDLLGNIGMGTW